MNGTMRVLKDAAGNDYPAYVSGPAHGRAPGVVIGMDIGGMRPLFCDIADAFAAQGYLAAVPDYFWDVPRGEDGSYLRTLKFPTLVAVTQSTMASLKAMPECNGKVAVTGFCVGGNLAYLGVTRFGADAAAAYYATRVHTMLDQVDTISRPLLLHMAEHDHTFADEERDRILAAVAGNPLITAYVYDAPHGFASSTVDEAARALANQRTYALFATLK